MPFKVIQGDRFWYQAMINRPTNLLRKIAENFNRLTRAHERYRQTTDRRQTDGRQQIANVNVSSHSLKTMSRIETVSNLESLFLLTMDSITAYQQSLISSL